MTGETLGTARVDLVVNTDQFVAGVSAMNKSLEGMGKASQSAAKQAADNIAKTNAAAKTVSASANASTSAIEQNSKRQIASLQKQIAFLGASREEQLRWVIAQRTSGEAAALLNKQLDAQVAKLKQSTNALGGTGKSAKELQFAMRGLPAQITDIVTGLASGQRPLTILFQQGGQLKDMFGGIVPAARALGGAIANMVNPFTIAAAAVVGLGVAFSKAAEESENFNKALILSGNQAGLNTQKLEAMAASVAKATNTTQGQVSGALAQVAASGQFTAQQMQQVTQAAVLMQQATGRAVEKTIKDFASLKGDPLDGILKLNDAIGDGTNVTHFLSQATAEQIAKLKEQGDEAGATALAFHALYDAINSRAPQAAQQMGLFSAVLQGIKKDAQSDLDSIVGFFRGADEAIRGFIANQQKFLRGATFLMPLPYQFQARKTLDELAAAAAKASRPSFANFTDGSGAADSGRIRDQQKALEEFSNLSESVLSKEEKHRLEINKIREAGVKAGKSQLEIDTAVANANARYAEGNKKRSGGAAGVESATSRNALQAFEDELKKEQGLIANQTQLLEANYAARNISAEQYYAEQKRLAQEATAAQTQALEGEIAVLQARNVNGKTSIENATELAQKEAELAKVRADGATKLQVLSIQEAANLKQRQQANVAYQDALDQQKDALKAELDSQVLRVTVGEREFEIRSRIIQLYRDEAKELLNLARQRDAGEIDPNTYQQRVAQLQQAIAAEVRIVRQGYDQMAQAQANWANGALKAFADYRDAANDVAGQTYSIFSDSLHGLEDVLTDFFTKGKADWKGFFDGIAAEITRFIIRQQLSKLVKKFIPGMADDSQNNADALKGAATSLAASAAPLYGAAAALSASAAALAAAGAGGGGATGGGQSGYAGLISSIASMWGGGFAKGGAFVGGREVQAFAYGGVIGSPTYFPMAGGKMGLMGEEKPEAIMPLKRGPDGRLGVVAEVPRRQSPQNISITVPVQGQVDTRTKLQVAQETARQIRRSARN